MTEKIRKRWRTVLAAGMAASLCVLWSPRQIHGQATQTDLLPSCQSKNERGEKCEFELPQKKYTRRDFDAFAEGKDGEVRLKHLRAGVEAMMDLDESNPLSWKYQAFIHGTFVPRDMQKPLWDCCKHTTWFFLSWHRMEIFYFERILRAMSGDDDLALPYWNFTDKDNPEKRKLPKAFRCEHGFNEKGECAEKGERNPLFFGHRREGLNGANGLPLCTEVVDWKTAFDLPRFFIPSRGKRPGIESFGGKEGPPTHFTAPEEKRRGALEARPHDIGHGVIGDGTDMSMSHPDGAGLDPIFWPFHVNMDRAWSCWVAAHPDFRRPEGRWLTEKFKFFDVEKVKVKDQDGKEKVELKAKEVCLTGAQIVNTAEQLHYQYDNCKPFTTKKPPDQGNFAVQSSSLSAPADTETAESVLSATAPSPVELGAEPTTVSIELPGAVQQRIHSLVLGELPDAAIVLNVEAIQIDKTTGSYYQVYLNLPDGAEPDYQSRYYAGALSFFGAGHRMYGDEGGAMEAPEGDIRSFDVTEVVRQLAAHNEWLEDKVSVTFAVPEQAEAENCVRVGPPAPDVHARFAQLTLNVIGPELGGH